VNDPIVESAQEAIASLVEQSSLGGTGAHQLRNRVPTRVAEEIRSRANAGLAVALDGPADTQVGTDTIQVNYAYAPKTWTTKLAQTSAHACPYRGLNVFEESDQEFFFGRESAIVEVMERLSAHADNGFLVISGESGVGKSSLLRSGVLPRLRRDGLAEDPGAMSWPCLLFTPGPAPLAELATHVAALAGLGTTETRQVLGTDPAGFGLLARLAVVARGLSADDRAPSGRQRLILVIDQFEQIFTQCPDEQERRAFVTALHSATFDATAFSGRTALVVLGVRADFEARCAEYPELAEAIQRRYLLTAMTTRQLRLAITGPAERAGVHVEPALTNCLLQEFRGHRPESSAAGSSVEARSRAGSLPLLSYALSETWRVRAGGSLALGDYRRTGGIEAAVANAAQRVYDGLTPAQQDTARQVFLQLVTTSADGTAITVPATEADLAEGKNAGDVGAVLEAFSRARLLTLTTHGAEISHDVLLTAWPLLWDTWLAETRAAREIRSRLRGAAADWATHVNNPAYLWRGSLLASAAAARADAAQGRLPTLTWNERSFLAASTHAVRRGRRWRKVLCVLPVLLVAVLVAVSVIRADQQRSLTQQTLATAEQLANESLALDGTNPSLAQLMSVAAYRINPSSVNSRYSMFAAAMTTASTPAILPGTRGQVSSVAFSPDSKLLATAEDNAPGQGEVELWDTATMLLTATLPVHGSFSAHASWSLQFDPAGTLLAAGTPGGSIFLWNAADGRLLTTLASCPGYTDTVLTFSPDGNFLAVAAGAAGSPGRGCLELWDLGNPSHPALRGQWRTSEATSLAFSASGKILAEGTAAGVQLRNVTSGWPIIGLSTGPVSSLAFSADGILAVGTLNSVELWDITSMRLSGAVIPSASGVSDVAISPDGGVLAAATPDGTQLWDIATHQRIGAPLATASGRASVAFSPDGTELAVGTSGHGTNLWDVGFLQPSRTPAYLCRQAGHPLTPRQWAQYAPGLLYQDICPALP